MTKDELKTRGGKVTHFFGEELKKWVARLLLTITVVVLTYIATPLGEQVAAIWNTPATLREQQEKQNEVNDLILDTLGRISADVQILKRPEEIFELSIQNTFPVEGYCIEQEPCVINMRIRRRSEATTCRIVGGSVQWGFINPRSDSFVPARRVDTPTGRNIGMNWEDVQITLITPSNLEPEADFTFEAFYTDCPGTLSEDDPISRRSPRDRMRIYSEEPNDGR